MLQILIFNLWTKTLTDEIFKLCPSLFSLRQYYEQDDPCSSENCGRTFNEGHGNKWTIIPCIPTVKENNPGLLSMSITHQCTIKSEYFPLPPECLTGSYGDECEKSCSGHCAGQYKQACNHVDGSCDRGCQPGYHGKTCHQGRCQGFLLSDTKPGQFVS